MTLAISDDAFNLIVAEEDSNAAYYARHYTHFDWPQGASGPTIGIGYDCGYVTPGEARIDWDGIVSDETIEAIIKACGLRSGDAAAFVKAHSSSVTVTWDQAITEFRTREVPKWITRIHAELQNLEKLSPDSLGALVSLAYNRGCSFTLPGPRYAEMRSIRLHMATQQFAKIPDDILSMQRLWPRGGDLWNRRAHEAALFRKGLNEQPIQPS